MFSAVMDVCIYHINISPNHHFSLFFSHASTSHCVMGPILVTCYILPPLLPLHSLCIYLTLPPWVSHHSFCCHSTLVIRLSVLIMALLIVGHQIIIQTFHADEVRGVIQHGPVKTRRRFCWCHLLELEIIVPAKRVSAATGM